MQSTPPVKSSSIYLIWCLNLSTQSGGGMVAGCWVLGDRPADRVGGICPRSVGWEILCSIDVCRMILAPKVSGVQLIALSDQEYATCSIEMCNLHNHPCQMCNIAQSHPAEARTIALAKCVALQNLILPKCCMHNRPYQMCNIAQSHPKGRDEYHIKSHRLSVYALTVSSHPDTDNK